VSRIPLDKVNDPREQNCGSFRNLCKCLQRII
jgi:hypothetical protein